MKTLLTLLLATLCAATGYGQTIKTLGYNTTNGEIVAATNVVWTNAFSFSTNTVAAQVRTNAGLGAAWLTNTNVTNFRSAIGLGVTNDVQFGRIYFSNNWRFESDASGSGIDVRYLDSLALSFNGNPNNGIVGIRLANHQGVESRDWSYGFTTNNTTGAAKSRTNFGLGLPALTNTSNVTMMRALAGVTNGPVNAAVTLSDGVLTWVLTFSNGILVNLVEE